MSVLLDRFLLVLLLVLVPACGRQRPGGDDDDDDLVAGGDSDADSDVIVGGEAVEYEGTATGSWNGYVVSGDVALSVDGSMATADLAVSNQAGLVFTAHSGWIDVDRFGNLLGDLTAEGPDVDTSITFSGSVDGNAGSGEWSNEFYGDGSWTATLQ